MTGRSKSTFYAFYPSDWLAGTRGMTAAETGVYITLIAMMYEREQPLNMEYARLARLCGIPAGSFTKCVKNLISEGKLLVTENGLWHERVAREIAHTRARSDAGRAGAESRWAFKNEGLHPHSDFSENEGYRAEKNNEINEATMRDQCGSDANQTQTQNIGGGGSSACAKKPDFPGPEKPDLTEREEALIAMGHEPNAMTVTGRVFGSQADMLEKKRWTDDLGLTHEQQITVIRETMAAKRDGPPISFRYFTKSMQRFAAELAQERLRPAQIEAISPPMQRAVNGYDPPARVAQKHERLQRVIGAAATGTTNKDWG